MTLVIILLHVFWGIVFFDGCEKKKWYILLIVLLTHLLVSAQVSVVTVLELFFETQVLYLK
jgi:anterior pharynx defective protein 1